MNYDDWSLIRLGNLVYAPHLKEDPPLERGRFGYDRKGALTAWDKDEGQVDGSISRYNHPKYKALHYGIMHLTTQRPRVCTSLYIRSILAHCGQWTTSVTMAMPFGCTMPCFVSIHTAMANSMGLASITMLWSLVSARYLTQPTL